MRLRTVLLLILVIVAGAITTWLVLQTRSGNDPLAMLQPNRAQPTPVAPDTPPPTPTPAVRLISVVVAGTDIPIGTRLTANLLQVVRRPETNIALQGGYTLADPAQLEGEIVKVNVARGQEILLPMLAADASDVAALGSDLSLYVDEGRVAVAIPIDTYSGAAYALRPGDAVDVMMSLRAVEIDPEFRTALPNETQRVIESELLAGQAFLFPPTTQGRLEFVEAISQVAEIIPSANALPGQDFPAGSPIPKRVTQLTIQQAEVLWVGTWPADPAPQPEPVAGTPVPTPTPEPVRPEVSPDLVILSMTSQDALALKWALERGINVDLALRSQGDTQTFETVSVSLPQIIDQGILSVPDAADFDLHPRADQVPVPQVPANPPD